MLELDGIRRVFADIVGEGNVVVGGEARYGWGALMGYRAFRRPKLRRENLIIITPGSAEEVAEVVKTANRNGIPIIPYGGGTGVMGGAAPTVEPAVMIDLRRMDRVIEVSYEDLTATAEAGVSIQKLNEAAAEKGLMFAHDPWSAPRATLGGAIATSGMGYYVAGYGSIREQVLGLEVVLPNGEILETRPAEFTSTGPSLKHIFIGSEGVFGVVTKATVRLHPLPEAEAMLGYEFPSFDAGFNAVKAMRRAKIRTSVLDMGEEAYGDADPTHDYEAELFILVEGFKEEVEAKISRIEKICREYGGERLSEGWAREFWKNRHALIHVYEKYLETGRDVEWLHENLLDYIHVYLPTSKVLEYKKKTAEIMKQHGLLLYERGLWGYPEVFSIVFYRPAEPSREEALEEAEEAIDKMLTLCQGMGGSMEHCHGVGIRLAKHMLREHGEAGIKLLQTLKNAIDQNNVMNPGKLIPKTSGLT